MSDELETLKRHSHSFVDISAGEYRASISTFGGGLSSLDSVSYTHLTLPTTPYV